MYAILMRTPPAMAMAPPVGDILRNRWRALAATFGGLLGDLVPQPASPPEADGGLPPEWFRFPPF
jgi:hypothetical protein